MNEFFKTQFALNLISFPFSHLGLPQTKIALYAVVILIALLPVVLMMWLFIRIMDYVTDRMWENINNYRKGQEGENKVWKP